MEKDEDGSMILNDKILDEALVKAKSQAIEYHHNWRMKHGEDNSSPVCSVCFVSFFVMTSIAVSSVVPVAGFEQEVHPSANAIATSYPWFDEIEKTIIQSVVSTFGLDFLLFQDKLGGNVDTIHNVRKGIYASEAEETRYRIRQDYDSDEYHNHDDYIKAGKRNNQLQQEGCLHDAYRNSTMSCGEKYDRDHVISAKEIHDDPGRILAEQSGAELANQESNLHS